MKIGIFGGSFNPPHVGHTELCCFIKEAAQLNKIILIPTGDNPMKDSDDKIDRWHRFEMAKLASEKFHFISVSDIEILREGDSYTVDTVRELNKKGGDEYYFICGCDLLFQMNDWKNYSQLCEEVHFLCVMRKGIDLNAAIKSAENLNNKFGAAITFFYNYMPTEISSTKLRLMLENNEDCSGVLDVNVSEYIKLNHLYGSK